MADEQQLVVLRQRWRVWNAWREQNPHVQVDLEGAHLARANLNGANLGEANLTRAFLWGTDLRWANLTAADLPARRNSTGQT